MSRFPRKDYRPLSPYDPGRRPVAMDLSDNTNLWGVHPAALEVVRQAPPEALARYPSVYGQELKAAVARKYDLPVECVATGAGSDDLLDSVFRAAALPPGRMSYPAPSFSMVEVFGRMNGMEVRAVPWEEAEGRCSSLLDSDPDLVYLCRPNNPTGQSMTWEWVLDLLAQGGDSGPILVVDEAYVDFGGESFIREAVCTTRLLVLRTLSKLYGLAGLRVGFAVGPGDVVAELEKSRGPYKVGQVAERAAVAALDDPSGWVDAVMERTVENRARLAEELRARGLPPLPSQANFLLVPVAPAGAVQVNEALREGGVATRPFPDLPGIGDALRITIGPWEMMESFLEALDRLLVPGAREREAE